MAHQDLFFSPNKLTPTPREEPRGPGGVRTQGREDEAARPGHKSLLVRDVAIVPLACLPGILCSYMPASVAVCMHCVRMGGWVYICMCG